LKVLLGDCPEPQYDPWEFVHPATILEAGSESSFLEAMEPLTHPIKIR